MQKDSLVKDTIAPEQWYLCNEGNAIIPKKFDEEMEVIINKGMDLSIQKAWKCLEKKEKRKNMVTVAILDTGINTENRELIDVMWKNKREIPDDRIDNDNNGYVDDIHGWDFVNNTGNLISDRMEEYDHGTMCAGIIGAKADDIGIVGVIRDEPVKLMSLKVLGDAGGNTEQPIIEAIQYAEQNGVNICNMSFNLYKKSKTLRKVIKDSKMFFVISAGNDALNLDMENSFCSRICLDNVIVVGSFDYNGKLDVFSNYGKESVDILAPGKKIYTTCSDGYVFASGTSLAAPMVSGVAALYLLYHSVSAQELKHIIIKRSLKKGELVNKVFDGTVLNAYTILR